MNLVFKEEGLSREYDQIPTGLKGVVEWFYHLSIAHFGITPVITRVLEHVDGDSGVHEAKRGVDIRDQHDGKSVYTPEQARFLLSEMNRRFPRTDGKLTMIHHSFCGGMYHFHLQWPAVPGTVKDNGSDENTPTQGE
jgi:hypothetical protein